MENIVIIQLQIKIGSKHTVWHAAHRTLSDRMQRNDCDVCFDLILLSNAILHDFPEEERINQRKS